MQLYIIDTVFAMPDAFLKLLKYLAEHENKLWK